jgi:ATP-dependent DNA helicase DinG
MIGLRDDSSLPSPDSDDAPPAPPPTLAPALAARLFGEGGILQHALGLEHRPQQARMASAVADAVVHDTPLVFEAGTGVGKSLAYLLPGIIHAFDHHRQLIVSTHTIALQEQLDRKDIPLCRRVFQADPATARYAEFKSAVLVGKGNYLCTSRLATALRDKNELFATPEHAELQRIAAWAETTPEGLRHELNPAPSPDVWELVNADSSACARKYCDCEKCPYQRAKARIRAAHLIIVNHSLLFAHIAAGGAPANGSAAKGVLFPDDLVVLDEAHTVPEVATDYFGLRLSSHGIDRLLRHLYNPKTRRGLLQKLGTPEERQLVADALEANHQFFAFLQEHHLLNQSIVRIRHENCAEAWLDAPLLALQKAVRTRADTYDEGREREELLEQAGKLRAAQLGLKRFLSLAEPDAHVYWLERTGRRQTVVALRSAPIDIAPQLKETLLERQTSVVFTSATLALADDIHPFLSRIGGPRVRAEIQHSPFDFARHMRVYLAADVPLPTRDESRLALDVLADHIDFCTRRCPGGSLVLFTSYADMQRVADLVEPIYRGAHRPFFIQGRDASRTELARLLREAGNGVLFGTESFWTGIDVPGDALSQVIITRLPFQVPTHPVLEARTEHVRARGGNPFNEITLPDALMTFRQGVGRLIRSARDRGLITILDSRIVQKAYGRQFLACLPQPRHTRFNRQNRTELFQPFA